MNFFRKKIIPKPYDKENKKPMIKASICNGEQAFLIQYQADEIQKGVWNLSGFRRIFFWVKIRWKGASACNWLCSMI